MDIRNVQKTGNMFYVYLPTSWCRKHSIDSSSKVTALMNTDGTLSLEPGINSKELKNLDLKVSENDQDILNKIVVACYINPLHSFKINLENEMDSTRLLDQKKLLNVELVEFDRKSITCESTVYISNPGTLLKTMITKVKNLISLMISHYNKELIDRYEEEIDRSKLLIEKSTLSRLTYQEKSLLKPTDLYYISNLAKSLERFTDHLRVLDQEIDYLKELESFIVESRKLIDLALGEKSDKIAKKSNLTYDLVIPLLRKLKAIGTREEIASKSKLSFSTQELNKIIIFGALERFVEVILDWSLTLNIE